MRSHTALALVAILVVLAGCSGGGAVATPDQSMAGGDGADGADGGDGASDGGDVRTGTPADSREAAATGQSDPGDRRRAIVRTGRIRLTVEDYERSRRAISERARELGGYVGDANLDRNRRGNRTWMTGYVVVRVPTDSYNAIRSTALEQGEVVSEETTTEDVADQLVDLEARRTNLERRRDRLRSFYDQADSTDELLEIEEELAAVQGEIEQVSAQIRSLERQVAYSTLRVELREPEPPERTEPAVEPDTTAYHEQSLTTVFMRSVHDIYVYLRAALVTVAGILPWLGLLATAGLCGLLSVRLWDRFGGVSSSWTGPERPPIGETDDPWFDDETATSDESASDEGGDDEGSDGEEGDDDSSDGTGDTTLRGP